MNELTPEEAARVAVNGRDGGGSPGAPLHVSVTLHLKHGRNTIRIEPFAPSTGRLTVYER